MKLSKLRSLCDKAIEKYGDIKIGGHITDDARDVEEYDDLKDIYFRVLSPNSNNLPGDALEETCTPEDESQPFVAIFVNY